MFARCSFALASLILIPCKGWVCFGFDLALQSGGNGWRIPETIMISTVYPRFSAPAVCRGRSMSLILEDAPRHQASNLDYDTVPPPRCSMPAPGVRRTAPIRTRCRRASQARSSYPGRSGRYVDPVPRQHVLFGMMSGAFAAAPEGCTQGTRPASNLV